MGFSESVTEFASEVIEFQIRISSIFLSSERPDRGEIMLDKDRWRYAKHGLGVQFIRVKDERVIDIETHLDAPEKVSAWRVALYAESVGVYIEERDIRAVLDSDRKWRRDGELYYKKKLIGCLAR